MRSAIKSGVTITFQAKALTEASDVDVMIETPNGPVKIPTSFIVSVDVQEVIEGSPVVSTMANRTGLSGIVLAIDSGEAWVRWHTGRSSPEKINTLRVQRMSPV